MPTIAPLSVKFSACPVAYAILRKPEHAISGDWSSGYSADLSFVVAASDLYTFISWAGGLVYTINVGGVPVNRVIPASHPDLPNLMVSKVKSLAFGQFTATNTASLTNYSQARVTFTFAQVPWATDGSTPFMMISTRAGSEVYTAAGQKLAFPSDGSVINADAGVTITTIAYQITIYQAASLDDVTAGSLTATPVNSAIFLGQPIGTMRFDGLQAETTLTLGGGVAYQKTLMVTFREIPWNQYLRPDFTWEAPKNPAGNFVYGTTDLNALLQ